MFCPKSYFLNDNCLEVGNWFGHMDWNTSVSLQHHIAKQAEYSVLNASILSVGDRHPTSTPVVHSHDLLELYDYVLNNDTADFSDPNVTSQSLISNLMYLQSIQTKLPVVFYGSDMLSYLQGFVALPLLMFQPTWTADPRILGTAIPELVPNVTTTGVYSETISRILIAKWTAVTFAAMLVSVYCQCILCLYWASKNPGPSNTQFPLLDFAVSLYTWNKPIARLLTSRGLDSRLYRENLERQALGTADNQHDQSVPGKGSWNWSGTNDAIPGYCYT
jgi:hypothetical protein